MRLLKGKVSALQCRNKLELSSSSTRGKGRVAFDIHSSMPRYLTLPQKTKKKKFKKNFFFHLPENPHFYPLGQQKTALGMGDAFENVSI